MGPKDIGAAKLAAVHECVLGVGMDINLIKIIL